MGLSTTSLASKEQKFMEEAKGAQVQLGESSHLGMARLPLTEAKPRDSSQSFSPYPAASKKAANEKGSPLVIVASHKRALQNAQA